MIRAYDNSYLDDVRNNLAVMLDFAVNTCAYRLDEFYSWFMISGVSDFISKGLPRYLAGLSGIELADRVVARVGQMLPEHEPYVLESCSKEYWTGWALAYVQWYTGMPFVTLSRYGIDASFLCGLYPTLHEADDSKLIDVVLKRIDCRDNLAEYRRRRGLTQSELASISGVSLRMIRAYEQKSQDIAKAESLTVLNLSKALHCSVGDLLGV